ncbi:TPA: PTS sugar transporter subunit IIB [Streptococcus suis]|uniref:PTS sugar transporter subunit IIB n=2 Tax=Streptococcus TaxID=1301 RepID=A0A9X4MU49_STRSU|nr:MULTISPECIES: PTS sugar transporter subunit IIB [Streptococcus]MCK4025689.1 PTS sugar transporter subunit IIB [Streptococcus suis]MDG4527001.1 PTS sugar transporter subunit IIB [Streptococcus suis]MDG4529399.1 PTS sugar transporter subunit IIB [Streptococcus suis]MDN3007047.1 PTS sugar transporter subunit IIB [Streptococcus suis]MDN3009371.1 PTS sugar transporter subunit IIB [Streptococcus suis]
MTIVFSRIDDRLIHGQVVTTWVNMHKIEQIIVLNDKVAGDKTQKSILTMAAPQGISVKAFPVEKFGEIIKTNKITRRTMLLFTTSEDVLRAYEVGVPIPSLNVGGMRFQEGREKLTKSVAVTPSEKEAFKKLLENSVEVTIQMVPNDEKIKLEEVIL